MQWRHRFQILMQPPFDFHIGFHRGSCDAGVAFSFPGCSPFHFQIGVIRVRANQVLLSESHVGAYFTFTWAFIGVRAIQTPFAETLARKCLVDIETKGKHLDAHPRRIAPIPFSSRSS